MMAWPMKKSAKLITSPATNAVSVKTMTLAARTRARLGVLIKVALIRPLEYSLLTTRTPSTMKARRPSSHPAWMMWRGWARASAPALWWFWATANEIRADSPTTNNAATARVTGAERKVRNLAHSARMVSARVGTGPATGPHDDVGTGLGGAGRGAVAVMAALPRRARLPPRGRQLGRGTRRLLWSAP